jgi:hypothetical protein
MSRTAPRGYELEVQFDGVPSAIRLGDRDAISLDECAAFRLQRRRLLPRDRTRDHRRHRCRRRRRACPRNWNIFGGYTYLHQTYANGELKGERFRPADARKSVQDGDALHCSEDDRQQCAVPRRYFCGRSESSRTLHGASSRMESGLRPDDEVPDDRADLYPAHVDNLFDETYYSGIRVPYHGQAYGDPRKATLTLRKSF